MGHDAEAWRRLRSEFVEAAAKYDQYETSIKRDEQSEDWYCNNGRYLPIGLIRWPYGPYRKCWILAPDSGTDAEPFSAMKTLFNKAWLWLPRGISDEVLETAEMHLSPPADIGLYWARSHYQHWCWLLWFYWLKQLRAEKPTEAAKPSSEMVMSPFQCSAELIAQWGLDGSDGKIPEWLGQKQHGEGDKFSGEANPTPHNVEANPGKEATGEESGCSEARTTTTELLKLSETERLAYQAYELVNKNAGRRLKPLEAFKAIKELKDDESNGYKPISVEALARAERRARGKLGEVTPKKPTAKTTSRSVVKISELD